MFGEDLSIYFDPDDSVAAIYETVTIYGRFGKDYVEVHGAESYAPLFLCRESDVSGVTNQSSITINSVNYNVIEPQPDGTGLIRLVLHEA